MKISGQIDTLSKLLKAFKDQGVTRLVFKELARNDNTKQQVYLGSSFNVINTIPFKEIREDSSAKIANFKAALDFFWLNRSGTIAPAPHAQLILYPDYPEVRLSGFLKGCKNSPSGLMQAYPRPPEGRILFLGVREDQRIIAFLVGPEDPIAVELAQKTDLQKINEVFSGLNLNIGGPDPKTDLLQRLKEIHEHKWYVCQRLGIGGLLTNPYTSKSGGKVNNGAGLTLESLFGIIQNAKSEPDYRGWELKSFKVSKISKSSGGRLTLMTPEPTLGYYSEHGAADFVRKFGHVAKEPDALYFTGNHKVDEICKTSNLYMKLEGFDLATKKITNISGGIHLITDTGSLAAGWAFKDLFEHWKLKHAQAAYIPYVNKNVNPEEYWFGNNVLLGEGANIDNFLSSLANKTIIYDPGVKVAKASTTSSKVKARSQFRITSKELGSIYDSFTTVDLLTI